MALLNKTVWTCLWNKHKTEWTENLKDGGDEVTWKPAILLVIKRLKANYWTIIIVHFSCLLSRGFVKIAHNPAPDQYAGVDNSLTDTLSCKESLYM